jgi:pyruvate kinase
MQNSTHTKIVCTIGPAVNTFKGISQLIEAGMNVARINFSHGSHKDHAETIERLKKARKLSGKPLSIMLDTKGPEIRVGKFSKEKIEIIQGNTATLVTNDVSGDENHIPIHPKSIFPYLNEGDTILFDDGYISSKVIDTKDGVKVEFLNNGNLKSGKGVNIPEVDVHLPALTDQDLEDIIFGCKHDLDIIAASFIRSSEHVMTIKRLLKAHGGNSTLIFAKIENSEGINNFDSILSVSDGIMIARGDLGVEIPISQVPKLQKQMIRKCYTSGKPSVTATQMLESMIVNPRPTRAEVSDVANAIYDSTTMVMLSGETAIGKYPIKTVEVMKSIIKESESDIDYRQRFFLRSQREFQDIPSSVTLAMISTGFSSNAKAIIALTNSGRTARLASSFRPGIPVIASTSNKKTYNQLASNWGVTPFLTETSTNVEDAYNCISEQLLKDKHVNFGDLVVVTAGSPFGITGTTNMMLVKSIGNVLLRGFIGYGKSIQGKIAIILSTQEIDSSYTKGKILVLSQCNEEYFPLIENASGVILEKSVEDNNSQESLINFTSLLHIPTLITGELASHILKEDQFITLNCEQKIVH